MEKLKIKLDLAHDCTGSHNWEIKKFALIMVPLMVSFPQIVIIKMENAYEMDGITHKI